MLQPWLDLGYNKYKLHALQTMHGSCATNQEVKKVFDYVKCVLYRFVENVFNYVKFCAVRFARRTVIYLVLYTVYADGGNIHGPYSYVHTLML